MAEGSSRLSAYVAWVCARAKPILVVLTLLTLVFGAFAYSKFRINSDLHDLIDQTSDWRAHFDRFQEAFPDLVKTGEAYFLQDEPMVIDGEDNIYLTGQLVGVMVLNDSLQIQSRDGNTDLFLLKSK